MNDFFYFILPQRVLTLVYSCHYVGQNFCRIGLVVLFCPRVEANMLADFRKMEKEQR